MESNSFQRNQCRACKSRNLELVLPLAPIPIADAYVSKECLNEAQNTYPLEVFLCKNCGLVQLLETIDPEILYSKFLYETSTSLGLAAHFQKYAHEVFKKIGPQKDSLIVDIGSNDGTLLKAFKGEGATNVLGIDPAEDISKKATKNGIKTVPKFFNMGLANEITKEYGLAGIVTSNNTLANIDNLAEFIGAIKQLIDDHGVFIFETVYLVDLLTNAVFDNIYHEHLNYFSVGALKKLFQLHNLELADVERIETKGGSIRCYVQHKQGPLKTSSSVNELISMENGLKITSAEIYTKLSKKLERHKHELRHFLTDLRSKGKIIAGYCASQSVTTFLYYFGIGEFIKFIADDNSIKHGTFSPGLHIPVLPPDEIYRQKPDFIIILAWRYSDPIIKKHQLYLNGNGSFIVPFPAIELFDKSGMKEAAKHQ